ncbi:MAG: PAS domain S-box protein [Acidobacteriia bacterium]|nr:PAS domain S-box protein [Terriglobia bacterium]
MSATGSTKSLVGPPPSRTRGWLLRYGFALLAVAVAGALRYWLGMFGLTAPYITFYPIVMLVAIVAGLGPGLLATLLSLIAAAHFFLGPAGFAVESLGDRIGMALFLVMGAAINVLAEAMRRRNTQLRRSRADLNRAQAIAQVGSWYLDIPNNVLTWSDEAYRLFEVPIGTPLSLEAFLDRVHPADRQQVLDAWSAALKGAPYDIEHRVLVDGKTKRVRERAEVEFGAGGKPQFATGTVQDITERKQADENLQKSIVEIEDLYNRAPCGYHSLDPDGVLVRINDTELDWLGYKREEVLGKLNLADVLTPETRKTFEESYPKFKATGQVKDLYFELIRKNGTVLPVLVSATAIRDSAGNFLMSRSTVYDIAERKQAEEAVQKSEQRLNLALDSGQMGIWELDLTNDTAIRNLRHDQIFGYQSLQPEWGREIFLSHIVPEDRDAVRKQFEQAAATGNFFLECPITWPDQSIHWICAQGKAFRDAQGKPVKMMGTVADITERKWAEEELRKSKNDWELTFDAVPDLVMLLDADNRILRANRALCSFLGMDHSALLGKRCFEVVHHQTAPHRDCPLKFMLMTGQGQQGEIAEPSLGKIFDVSVTPVWEGKTFRGAVHVMRDITDRKRAEGRLRQQLRVNDAMFDQAIACFVLLDPEFNFIRVNEAYAKACHRKVEDFPGRNHFELYPSDTKALFDEVVRSGLPIQVLARPFSFPDQPERGTTYWDWTLQPIFDETGTLEFLFLSLNDVTEHERARQDLKQSQDELARKHEQVRKASLYTRSLIEASPDPLVTISPEGKITDVNAATETVTGLSRERLTGSDFCDYFTEPGQAREIYQQVFEKGSVHDYPLAIRHASGHITHVLYNASVFKNQAGQVEGVFAAARDISERKTLEEQLLQAQKLEAIGRLAGGVAHDFNNIMAVILGFSGLIQERLAPDHPIRQPVENIQRAAERAAGVTRQLLAFSRKQVMKPKVLELNDVITEASKMLVRLIGENIDLVLKLSADLARVQADPIQIEQVLMNLALNARDAMPKGGTLTISTSNTELNHDYQQMHAPIVPGPYAMISVSDTGVGMKEETRSHVFEPFFTTKPMGQGTGLGLSIVYGIVKQSGGNIWVYSEAGQGTTFKIYLPAIDVPKETVHQLEPAMISAPGSGTILVVEDEAALAELTRTVLERQGYSVLAANSGEEALNLARSHQGSIQLLLTDIILRGRMDGFELASLFHAERPGMKVLYMSGYSDALNSPRREVDPNATLLEKPFTTQELRAKVSEILTMKLSA